MILSLGAFNFFLVSMAIVAAIVFVALYFVQAGYGMMISKKWGVAIPNRIAWVLMEAPVFVVMCLLFFFSDRQKEIVPMIFFLLFQFHYFQRSFIFPFLIKGKSKMPISIMSMGIVFNVLNGYMQGVWLFFLAPKEMYQTSWLCSPQFILGAIIFFFGMAVNWHSDYVIRHLRKPGDTNHYLPKKGFYRFVTSANYFGEIVEWTGWAILTWSFSGAVFAVWTMANLVPRANSIYKKYGEMFAPEFQKLRLKRIFPFIY